MRRQLNVRISDALATRLYRYAIDVNGTVSLLAEAALEDYLERRSADDGGALVGTSPLSLRDQRRGVGRPSKGGDQWSVVVQRRLTRIVKRSGRPNQIALLSRRAAANADSLPTPATMSGAERATLATGMRAITVRREDLPVASNAMAATREDSDG